MQKRPTSDDRARKVSEGIRIATDSLISHLEYTHGVSKKYLIRNETKVFHRKCVRDYAKLIHLLSQLF